MSDFQMSSSPKDFFHGYAAAVRIYYVWNAFSSLHNLGHQFFFAGRSPIFLSIGKSLFNSTISLTSPKNEELSWSLLTPLTRETIIQWLNNIASKSDNIVKWFSPLLVERILQLTGGIPRLIIFTIEYLATHSPEEGLDWEENYVSFMLDSDKKSTPVSKYYSLQLLATPFIEGN